ncbi:MAG: glycogen debranching protein [Thermoplasmata archaeon]|nr:MAG: glycogen debranching protein [Thermoplasmata archaeon]
MREWIVTNGLGSYASLTYQNTNTRKFHGLLIASLNPPTERWVFVSNIYDKLQINDEEHNLTDFKPVFNFKFFPSFTYNIEDVKIEKTILMEYEKNTTIIKYEISSKKPVTIIHQPIVNSRHFYDVNSQRYLSFTEEKTTDGVNLKPSNIDKHLKIILKNSSYQPSFYWETLYYSKDQERNDSWVDNNVHIGDFYKTVRNMEEYYLILTIEEEKHIDPQAVYNKEIQRKKNLLTQANLPRKFEKLVLSTDNFIVKKGTGKSVIAGYHWFGDWGRDTLVSLPGLTLVTKRFNDAKQILQSFSEYCKNGLIPNVFMDRDSQPVYNTVDASLWYIDRVFQYLKYTNDKNFLINIWNTLESIIQEYKKGTDYDIYMDEDYLISHGPGLTWMDVKIGDHYITPRAKKAVEIQALWYNALRIMGVLADILKKENPYVTLSEKVKESFNKKFDQIYDVIDTRDTSIRPNQIFLVSLDHVMIDEKLQNKIVKTVQDKLLTIFGLRTLAPDDPRYKGTYLGEYNRDEAYHNGTVWPWLMGPFIKAFVKTKKHHPAWREYAYHNFLRPMLETFNTEWDGSIHEIFDGDPIYTPRGCITQAWSVAEILRAWVEDIENIKPRYEEFYKTHTHQI